MKIVLAILIVLTAGLVQAGPINYPGFVNLDEITPSVPVMETYYIICAVNDASPSQEITPSLIVREGLWPFTVQCPPPPSVPEPSTLLLLGIGLVGMGFGIKRIRE